MRKTRVRTEATRFWVARVSHFDLEPVEDQGRTGQNRSCHHVFSVLVVEGPDETRIPAFHGESVAVEELRAEETGGQPAVVLGPEPVGEFIEEVAGHAVAAGALGDHDLVHVGGLRLGFDLVEEPAEQVAAIGDGDQKSVFRTELDGQFGGEEEAMETGDLLGVEGVADAVDPSVRIIEGDDHLAVLDPAGDRGDIFGLVLGPEIGVGEAGEEIVVFGIEIEMGAQIGHRRAEVIGLHLPGAEVADDPFEAFGEGSGTSRRTVSRKNRARLSG